MPAPIGPQLGSALRLKAALIHDVLLESGSRTFEADSQWRAAALSEKAPDFRTGVAFAGMIFRRYAQWILNRGRPANPPISGGKGRYQRPSTTGRLSRPARRPDQR